VNILELDTLHHTNLGHFRPWLEPVFFDQAHRDSRKGRIKRDSRKRRDRRAERGERR